jgi:mRNA-degrading endonuclease toxin of MazEF toxin-antitoxin module
MEFVLGSAWARDPWKRRGALAAAMFVLAVLSVWPRHYVAHTEMLPNDAGNTLSSVLGSAGGTAGGVLAFGSLIGNHASPIESDLTISRSQVVVADVVRRLHAEGRLSGDLERAKAKLHHKAQMEALRGGILRVTVVDHDPAFAEAAVTDYVAAITSRVAAITRVQAARKRAVTISRLNAATIELAQAQQAVDRFRAAHKLAAPEVQLGAAVSLVTGLQGRLDADEAQLQALQRFATPGNFQVQALQSEVAALRSQIIDAQANANNSPGPSVGGMTPIMTEYENLYRNERFEEAEYEIYKRYLGTVSVEDLAADINMDIVEPPYVDPDRQFNAPAVGALVLVILLGLLAEFYIAQSRGWRPAGTARDDVSS